MADYVAIEPGLANLNLNIAFENDMQLIADSVEDLNKRLTEEHTVVHYVLKNMIAILKSNSSRGKIESREYLENILRCDPRNLNALADIEQLSRSFHRTTEADQYKSRLENILQGQTAEDLRTKSICLMEQGYAILNDESANSEHISKNRLSESYRMLLSDHKKGTGRRKNYLQRCVYHNKQALSNLLLTIECKRQSQLLTRKIIALEKFEQAKGLYDVTIENIVWIFYIGVALNRKYDSIKDLYDEDGIDRFQEKKDVTLRATEIFWKIGTNKGCIADRDFEPGKFIFENIENSLRKSSKFLLVMTNHFVSSYWCQFETNPALLESIESRKDCIIPLYLEECDIPDKLRHITYADFTTDDDYIFEIMKLKRALLPE